MAASFLTRATDAWAGDKWALHILGICGAKLMKGPEEEHRVIRTSSSSLWEETYVSLTLTQLHLTQDGREG